MTIIMMKTIEYILILSEDCMPKGNANMRTHYTERAVKLLILLT